MTKAYLRSFRSKAKEMKQLQESLERLKELRSGVKATTFDRDSIKHQDDSSPTEQSIVHIMAVETEYKNRLENYGMQRLSIENAIRTLPSNQAAVIRAYYLDGLTWEETALELDISYTHVHRLHAAALRRLADIE